MAEYRNLTELVRAHAAHGAGRDALVLLHEDAGRMRGERVTYALLDAEARRLAGWLQQRGAAGKPVLVVHGSGRLFATSFLACLYAGAIAVPAPPPGTVRHNTERLVGIVKDTSADTVLTDAESAPGVSLLLAQNGYGRVACLATDAFREEAPPWREPGTGPGDVALLQYTSGSTSDPKGVVVTHANLLANLEVIAKALGGASETVTGSWLPFHHDMGLIGHLLFPLSVGGTAVLMPPEMFVRRPVRWLQAITEYGITAGGGPDFAYDLCVRRVTDEQMEGLDLSRWESACNGSEPVRAETLRAFARRFAPVGLRPGALWPCYGLAEATLMVTGGTPGGPARTVAVAARALEEGRFEEAAAPDGADRAEVRELVGCGTVNSGLELRIVDPESLRVLPEGRIGEIWVRGESVARGYWNRPLETAETFARATAGGEKGFLRTGDLGTLVDGELFVTGRLKDIMIVAGRNLYPQDMERVAQQVNSRFGFCTAFSVPAGPAGEEREQAVLIQEVRTSGSYDLDLADLAGRVRDTVAREFEIAVAGVLLVRPGTVRRTTSGKVQRPVMRDLFLRGRVEPLHAMLSPDVDGLVGAGGAGRPGAPGERP
ncbi:fatty acyl-AMP ligase [Streptomyces capparidis]